MKRLIYESRAFQDFSKTLKQLKSDLAALNGRSQISKIEISKLIWYVEGSVSERVLDGLYVFLKQSNINPEAFKIILTNN